MKRNIFYLKKKIYSLLKKIKTIKIKYIKYFGKRFKAENI